MSELITAQRWADADTSQILAWLNEAFESQPQKCWLTAGEVKYRLKHDVPEHEIEERLKDLYRQNSIKQVMDEAIPRFRLKKEWE